MYQVPKAGGSSVNVHLTSTDEIRNRKRTYDYPHLPFYSQQQINPDDIYLALFRNPISLFISFFNYVAQRTVLPSHIRCNVAFVGWEIAYKNKNNPIGFAKRYRDVMESDFLHYFLPTVPNASDVLRAWPPYSDMQDLKVSAKEVQTPWISEFPRKQYLQYLNGVGNATDNTSGGVIPEQYRCVPYVEASMLLLERYAAVGTTEKLNKAFEVLYRRAKITKRGNISKVINQSNKVMSTEVENEVKALLKEPMFCQTVMWRMAEEINAFDMKCLNGERQ
jgi:hypothetical protein